MSDLTPAVRAARIKLLVLDVDGVLTPNTAIYDHDGREIKVFYVPDGHGLKLIQRTGVEVAWLSGRKGKANEARAEGLGISELIEDAKIKLPILEELVARRGVAWEEVAYMGDDLIDLPPMRAVGLAMAPSDAIVEVRQTAHWVAKRPGGQGAVREACEFIMKSAGTWEDVTQRYL